MKIEIIRKIIISLMMIIFTFCIKPTEAMITKVHILPNEPTISDLITIDVYGVERQGPVYIDSYNYEAQGNILQLDIFLRLGFFDVMTGWSYRKDIGTLPLGTYNLTVRTFESTINTDTYLTTFEVVPEPSTILLLALGIFGIRFKK